MNPDYTFGTATLEIILMLLAAFVLGMLLCWLLRKLGICCPANPSNHPHERGREFPSKTAVGGYTQDINSLLRDQHPSPRQPASRNGSLDANLAASASAGAASLSAVGNVANGRKDDLKKLEGIGPKVEQLLNAAGISSYGQLAAATPVALQTILETAGRQFGLHDPKSWPYQAELAAKGEWNSLKEYQNLLLSDKGE